MYSKDAAIRPGQSITIEVSNKPYVDREIPPESNDYRWADRAYIEIYDPENALVANTQMDKIGDRIGWYTYRYQTTSSSLKGIYRVVVKMEVGSETPSTSGSSGSPNTVETTGSSGSPSSDYMTDVKVSYFHVMDLY
jgi:hypothetical protein